MNTVLPLFPADVDEFIGAAEGLFGAMLCAQVDVAKRKRGGYSVPLLRA